MKAVCLDTRVLSGFLKGKQIALDLIDNFQSKKFEIYTTTANISEFYMGMFKTNILSEKKIKEIDKFFKTLHPRPIDYNTGFLAGKLYSTELKGQEIGWRDTFIAASVLLNGQIIITSNYKHFERINDLEVIKYY